MTRHTRAAALGAATVMVLTACTFGSGSSEPPSPTGSPAAPTASPVDPATLFAPVALPEAFVPATSLVTDVDVLAPHDVASGLLVGLVADPGGAPRLGAWRTDAGEASPTELDVDLGGVPLSASAAASPELTAIAGTVLDDDGVLRPFVATSPDRQEWTIADAAAGSTDLWLVDATVVGERVLAVGSGADGGVHLLEVGPDGATPLAVALPSGGLELGPLAVAASEDEVAVLGAQVAPGGVTRFVVWASRDGGRTFVEGAVLDEAAWSATGVVRAGEEWLVVGTRPEGGFARPAAWSSTDLESWRLEDAAVESSNGWVPWAEMSDAVVGPPAVRPDASVDVWISSVSSVWGAVLTRAPDGTWSHGPASASRSPAAAPGPTGTVAGSAAGDVTVVNEASGWVRLASVDVEGWTDGTVLAERVELPWVVDADPSDPPRLVAYRSEIEVDAAEGAWRRNNATARFEYRDGALHELVEEDDDPAAFDRTAPDGSRTAFGVGEDDAAFLRYRVDDEWRAAEVDLDEVFGGMLYPGTRGWVGTLVQRPSFDVSSGRDRLSLASSADGERWERTDAAELVPDWAESSVGAGVCELPAGASVVVGSAAADSSLGMAWLRSEEGWTFRELADSRGLADCATTAEGIVAIGSTEAAAAWWTSSDGTSFELAATLPPRSTATTIESVDGLLVSGGWHWTESYRGPVLWLSADGAAWRWVPVPDANAGSPTVFSLGGSQVLVLTSPLGGANAWTVSDVAAAFEAATPLG